MGYEERYKELFSKLVSARTDKSKKDCAFCSVIDSIMSELVESEDERIRKKLISFFQRFPYERIDDAGTNANEAIAWLEKQKDNHKDIYKDIHKDIEQKPAWSEEDKEMSRFIGNAITANDASEYLESKAIQVIDAHVWLDGLRDRVQSQPKQEWSEEDEYYLNSCITKIEIDIQNWEGHGKTMIDVDKEIISWLKSLKERVQPQKTWKPSDEQINAFEQVYDWYNNNFAASETLTSLYQDLKKLKGE